MTQLDVDKQDSGPSGIHRALEHSSPQGGHLHVDNFTKG